MAEKVKNYHWLGERFREKIDRGEWRASERIPTERALSNEFGVTRVTIRRALRLLEDERLIRRRQGSGTYVNPKRARRIPLMIDYGGSMSEHAPELTRRLLGMRLSAATEELAAELNVKVGSKLLVGERIDYTTEAVVACDRFHIPAEFAENLSDQAFEEIDFIGVWTEALGFEISRCRQTVEAVTADEFCRTHMKLSPGSPVLKSTEHYYADNKKIAGMFVSFYHPGHICITSNYNWGMPR